MKCFSAILISAFMFSMSVFAQETVTHKVERGETINEIAQKYKVTPYDIYQLNPDAQTKLKPKSILLIPVKATKKDEVAEDKVLIHQVVAKETLYGIERKYGISDEELKKANPFLETEGLKIGQRLRIPAKNELPKKDIAGAKPIYHQVLPKETKYSIAKQYGITIEELEQLNPEVRHGLPIGYKLLIKGNASETAKLDEIAAQGEKQNFSNFTIYEVKSKETLYGLSKHFNISQEELLDLNPELQNGLAEGMILKVPDTTFGQTKKVFASLTEDVNLSERKKLAMLLPFNLSKIEGDTVNSVTVRLKKDKFLNMTLDFYAGALMAIDSARALGLPVDVQIFDSQESKNGSAVASIIQENNLQRANAVIGPFYQNNAETAARLLSLYNVPVISPLSKDLGNPLANLYQTVPSNEVLKAAMFDYMRSKNGNVLAVVDKKKESVIQYIKQNQADVKFVALNENGSVSEENLRSMLVKGRMNFVVMETRNTWMIKTTIAAMVNAVEDYQVQLVILEPNETLDSDEIKFENLVKLKLMYPSVACDNESEQAVVFKNGYRKINAVYPSDFATRGFDVTFDTILRLVQNKSFDQTANSINSQQIENKFHYHKNGDGRYVNNGVYILYYDTDLAIKVAN